MTTKRTLLLRFRDLSTRPGGTIEKHQEIVSSFGRVWWGWWGRDQEFPPLEILRELGDLISIQDSVTIYLYHSSQYRFYRAGLVEIAVAPPGQLLPVREPQLCPAYYHDAEYPAWFLFDHIEEVRFEDVRLRFDSFPTLSAPEDLVLLRGQPVQSIDQLRQIDATLIVVQLEEWTMESLWNDNVSEE